MVTYQEIFYLFEDRVSSGVGLRKVLSTGSNPIVTPL